MNRRYILPLTALLGIVIAITVIIKDNRPTPIRVPAIQPPESPYSSYIAGAGIVETALGNTMLGAPVPGIVVEIYVKVGDYVKAGDPLFKIDDRDLQAQLVTMTAKVKEAEAALQLPKHRLDYGQQLARRDTGAISHQELTNRQDEVILAQAALDLAQAQVRQLRMDIDRRTVHAPAAGQVLKIGLHPGEYVDGGNATSPVMLFGQNDNMYIRADIDENEEWRFRPGAEAVAFVRGNRKLKIPLRFKYIEPYITPKTALTGRGTERTDRRVLQVIYSFDPGDLPVHIGQQVDIFIQTQPAAQTSGNKDN